MGDAKQKLLYGGSGCGQMLGGRAKHKDHYSVKRRTPPASAPGGRSGSGV